MMAVEMLTRFNPQSVDARYQEFLDIAFQGGFGGLFPEQHFSSLGSLQPLPGDNDIDMFRVDAVAFIAEGMQFRAV